MKRRRFTQSLLFGSAVLVRGARRSGEQRSGRAEWQSESKRVEVAGVFDQSEGNDVV
jgi:hypothetical protein